MQKPEIDETAHQKECSLDVQSASPKTDKRADIDPDTEMNDEIDLKPVNVKDPFVIDEQDKQMVEFNRDPNQSIEIFPEMSPYPNQGEDESLLIGNHIDFDDEIDEEEIEQQEIETISEVNSLEPQSILECEDDADEAKTAKKNRFVKIGDHHLDEDSDYFIGKVTTSTMQNVRFAPYNKNNNNIKRSLSKSFVSSCTSSPINDNPTPSLIKPSLSFPENSSTSSSSSSKMSKTDASLTLLSEFTKICHQQTQYGICNGGINCNGNHNFPDPKWVKQMIYQMNVAEVRKFVNGCYRSTHCSRIYFSIFSTYFGDYKLKKELLEAIPMVESSDILLPNYKWIVDGLIRAGDTPKMAIHSLMSNRQKFTSNANKVVVEIIIKTKMEIEFLEKLVEISQSTPEALDVNMFHGFMVLAMTDLPHIELWKTLIEKIVQRLTRENVYDLLDQNLISEFIDFLEDHEDHST